MGYRDDAFYKLWANGVSEVANNENNAPFKWPSDTIRFLEAERTLSGQQTVSKYSNKLKRGYIRGLPQPGVHSASFRPMKCKFQFNPQTIVQSVTMREDVYLSILQDPVAFTQPFAGSVNFNFDLLFDRSLEVSKGVGPYSRSYSPADLNNPNYKNDVADIGVLADLQVLYAIIGQGFSKELLDFQKDRLAQGGRQIINKQGGVDSTDPNAVTEANIDQRAAGFANEVNLGNAAFLIPNPVRVVFSSLFMVEGFITGTNVDFLKFSTNMVPLQAKVSLSMNAVYIGYARQKTFLTDQLERAQDTIDEEQRQIEEGQTEIVQFAERTLGYFGFSTSSDTSGSFVEDVNKRVAPLDTSFSIARWIIKPQTAPIPESGSVTPIIPDPFARRMALGFLPSPNFTALPEFSDLEDSGSKIVANYTFNVYGPFPVSQWSTPGNYALETKLRGKYTGSIDSSASPSWGNDWALELSGSDSRLTNLATYAVPQDKISDPDFETTYVVNKFYYCTFSVTSKLTRTINGAEVVTTKSGTYSARVVADPTLFETKTSIFNGKIPMWGVVSGQRPGDTGV